MDPRLGGGEVGVGACGGGGQLVPQLLLRQQSQSPWQPQPPEG